MRLPRFALPVRPLDAGWMSQAHHLVESGRTQSAGMSVYFQIRRPSSAYDIRPLTVRLIV